MFSLWTLFYIAIAIGFMFVAFMVVVGIIVVIWQQTRKPVEAIKTVNYVRETVPIYMDPTANMNLTPKNPPQAVKASPDEMGLVRDWFSLKRQLKDRNVPQKEIDAYGMGLARHLLLDATEESASNRMPEVPTDEAV